MASPLEAQIKKQVAAAFRGKLIRGTIRRAGAASLDEFGDPVPGAPETFAFEGTRESYSAAYRVQAGIPAEDVKFLVLLGSVRPAASPRRGDHIRLTNTPWHMIREIPEVDPAGATAACQCYSVPDPDA